MLGLQPFLKSRQFATSQCFFLPLQGFVLTMIAKVIEPAKHLGHLVRTLEEGAEGLEINEIQFRLDSFDLSPSINES